jgi:hypothetical protein
LNFRRKKARLIYKKKKSGFQKEWPEIYKWLIYDEMKNLMFCSPCQSHKKLNKFGQEGNNFIFKTSALSEHASTKDHTDGAELIKVSNNSVNMAQNL